MDDLVYVGRGPCGCIWSAVFGDEYKDDIADMVIRGMTVTKEPGPVSIGARCDSCREADYKARRPDLAGVER